MRLPQPQLNSLCFLYKSPEELIHALGEHCTAEEGAEIQRLFGLGLPPITSVEALSVMFGYNPGFVWSLLKKTHRHYRLFSIPKGQGRRVISAPHVGLKAIQKWISIHFQNSWYAQKAVFGFVPGRSHIQAAKQHLGAQWIYSVDIENFFPSVSIKNVRSALARLGYRTDVSINLISRLACLQGGLAQGAPSSPCISNIVLNDVDEILTQIAGEHNLVFTRYADDIVFSGKSEMPPSLPELVKRTLAEAGWVLSDRKEEFSKLPSRLKVHGLLVHGSKLRLTKGYRNRIRAYRHLLGSHKIVDAERAKILGHIKYSEQIDV